MEVNTRTNQHLHKLGVAASSERGWGNTESASFFSLNAFQYVVFNFNLNLAPGLLQAIKDRKPNLPGRQYRAQVPGRRLPGSCPRPSPVGPPDDSWGAQEDTDGAGCKVRPWLSRLLPQRSQDVSWHHQRDSCLSDIYFFPSRYNLPIKII